MPDEPCKLYKIIFIGTEQKPDVDKFFASGSKDISTKPVKNIYQIYLWDFTAEQAMQQLRELATKNKIVIEDFTKISLVVSTSAINHFMKELI